jgi:hypothetical protein
VEKLTLEILDEEMIRLGRLAALRAFRIKTTAGSSSMSYFAGQKPPKKHAIKPKKSEVPADHDMSEEAGEKRARLKRRRMGHEEIHASATRPPGFSRPCLPDSQYLAGRIHKAIAELPQLENLWVNYAYRLPCVARREYAQNFHRRFFQEYEKQHLANARQGTRETIKALLQVAMQNEADPWHTVRPDIDPKERHNWKKTYRPHFFQMGVDISLLDKTALARLGDSIAKIPKIGLLD